MSMNPPILFAVREFCSLFQPHTALVSSAYSLTTFSQAKALQNPNLRYRRFIKNYSPHPTINVTPLQCLLMHNLLPIKHRLLIFSTTFQIVAAFSASTTHQQNAVLLYHLQLRKRKPTPLLRPSLRVVNLHIFKRFDDAESCSG